MYKDNFRLKTHFRESERDWMHHLSLFLCVAKRDVQSWSVLDMQRLEEFTDVQDFQSWSVLDMQRLEEFTDVQAFW